MSTVEETKAALDRAIELDVNCLDAYRLRAGVYAKLPDHASRLKDMRMAVRLAPDSDQIRRNLAASLMWGPDNTFHNPNEALLLIKEAIRLEPEEHLHHAYLADVYLQLGDTASRITALEKAIELAPSPAHSLRFRVELHQDRREFEQVVEVVAEVLKIMDHPQALLDRVEAYRELGKNKLALADLDHVLQITPDDARAYRYRGDIHSSEGRHDEALAAYTRAVELSPKTWYQYKRRADAYFRLGKYEEALADIERAVEGAPEDPSNLVWINVNEVAACPDEAFRAGMIQLADREIELTAGAEYAHSGKWRLLVAQGRIEEALPSAEKALAGLPGVACPYELLKALGQVADQPEAIPCLRQLAESDLGPSYQGYRIALALAGAGLMDSYRDVCLKMVRQFKVIDSFATAILSVG